MCLDPRPDRLVGRTRTTRTTRRLSRASSACATTFLAHAARVSMPAPVVRTPAWCAIDTLAGDDELVARGWVVLSRAH